MRLVYLYIVSLHIVVGGRYSQIVIGYKSITTEVIFKPVLGVRGKPYYFPVLLHFSVFRVKMLAVDAFPCPYALSALDAIICCHANHQPYHSVLNRLALRTP